MKYLNNEFRLFIKSHIHLWLLTLMFIINVCEISAQYALPYFCAHNNAPITARRFCNDISISYSEDDVYSNGIWFRFNINEASIISFNTSGSPAQIIPIIQLQEPMILSPGSQNYSVTEELFPPGTYYVVFDWLSNQNFVTSISNVVGIPCSDTEECPSCLPGFMPLPNKTYIIDGWAKQEGTPLGTVTYDTPRIIVEAPSGSQLNVFTPTGPIIEGWQRIEGRFEMPNDALSFQVKLETTLGTALFDDIRIFPADGSMKCYVYDPENLRFVAELDERNFATFYEYDNEGNLVRVKKETERGIKTLKETRQNAPHLEVQ